MAITVKYLEDLGVEKEVAEKIFAERSKEIEADKAKREKLETELKEKKHQMISCASVDGLAEKNENSNKRFEAVVGEKKFSHNAIKADYLKKFGEALELEENKSLSDEQVFHNLIKDDKNAFEGVTAVKLAGGRPSGTSGKTREEIMAIKDGNTRRAEMLANAHLFPELNK